MGCAPFMVEPTTTSAQGLRKNSKYAEVAEQGQRGLCVVPCAVQRKFWWGCRPLGTAQVKLTTLSGVAPSGRCAAQVDGQERTRPSTRQV